jgi:hypothetical protein
MLIPLNVPLSLCGLVIGFALSVAGSAAWPAAQPQAYMKKASKKLPLITPEQARSSVVKMIRIEYPRDTLLQHLADKIAKEAQVITSEGWLHAGILEL